MERLKYPIGMQDFEGLRTAGFVYVDKTDLVYQLAQEGKVYFLSRPRRFGKSLLLSTLEAYFLGKKELFRGLAIEKLETEWEEHPVLHLDLNTGEYKSAESLQNKLDAFLRPLEREFGKDDVLTEAGQRFEVLIKRIAEKTGKKVVVLVDEYDKPLLQALDNDALMEEYRSTLKAFYGVLKSADKYLRFSLLTGVTRFSKVSIFSDLNNLNDISLNSTYQTICGITDKEIDSYFSVSVKQLAENLGVDPVRAREMVKEMYDGYHFCPNGTNMYNPFSLLNCFYAGRLDDYWFQSGTPTFLVKVLQGGKVELPELTTDPVSADLLGDIDVYKTDPQPLLYQSGYLTIKGYDPEFKEFILGFPNKEVEQGFTKYLLRYYAPDKGSDSAVSIGKFIYDLRNGNPEDFMKRMEVLFSDTDYKIQGDAELYFQNVFYLVCKMLGFYTEAERTTNNGRMDLVVKTKDYIYIVEFKYDSTPEAALQQIEEKDYAKPFAMDKRRQYRIGVNFSRKKRCIDGWKVEE